MKNRLLASIVLPFFNSSRYIAVAIESVLAQSYENWELICVDDGSDDDGLRIVERFASLDSRLTIVRQEHKGAGAARNAGLEVVKGSIILFLDADDCLRLDAIKTLVDVSEQGSYDAIYFQATDSVDSKWVSGGDAVATDLIPRVFQTGADYMISEAKHKRWSPGAPLQALATDFVRRENLSFPEDLLFEDNLFSVRLKLRAGKVAVLDLPLYGVRERAGSLSRSEKTKQDVLSLLRTHSLALEEFEQRPHDGVRLLDEARDYVLWNFLRQARRYYFAACSMEKHSLKAELLDASQALRKETLVGFSRVVSPTRYALHAMLLRWNLRGLWFPQKEQPASVLGQV